MKIDTVLRHMNRIKLNGEGIKAVEIDRCGKSVLMDGPAFHRMFSEYKTGSHGKKYVVKNGVTIFTYWPDPDSDEADTRQEVQPCA